MTRNSATEAGEDSVSAAGHDSAAEAGDHGATVEAGRPATKPGTLRGAHADNTVVLRGRVSSAPVERRLPSGAVITTLRVSVARARTAMTSGSNQRVDWVDCAAWSARARRSVDRWQVGDVVEVTGALRRRFFRRGGDSSTRLEVEVISAQRVRPGEVG
jgi:single-strand DNA-binding protein